MRRQFTVLLAGLLSFGLSSAQAELVWSKKPSKGQHAGMQGGQQHGGGHMSQRRGNVLYLSDHAGAQAVMITPHLEEKELSFKGKQGKLDIPSSGFDNYHALVAVRQDEKLHESALRYVYMRGKTSGVSPSELVESDKLPLEIVPAPYVRAHRRFLSNKVIDLRVDFQGKPLANTWVGLSTSNGSQLEARTDGEGRVQFIFPDDFPDVKVGRSNNPAAEFTLRTGVSHEGILYRTTLSGPYSVNPSHWQSVNAGLFLLMAGFVTGIVVMRNKKPALAVKNKGAA